MIITTRRAKKAARTPSTVEFVRQIRLIGYGGMLVESFVAIMALIAACIIDPGLYYALNAPAGLLGGNVQSASQAVANLGFTITPEQLTAAAAAVQEPTLVARTGGAPTLAVGMSQIFSQIFGGDASGLSGTTSRSCSKRCSSSPRSTPAPEWGGSCCRTPSATFTGRCAT